ncbi:hypothetical protein TNCV_608531 [Trichonephila clavipes]|nr:hypothetical protein TNCV_608531 [Trichonephila clavipes]
MREREPTHISRRAFKNYNTNVKLKRSSPMQFDSEIRTPLGLEHNQFSIYQEPLFSPKNTTTCLLEPCPKRESTTPSMRRTEGSVQITWNLQHASADMQRIRISSQTCITCQSAIQGLEISPMD